MCRCTPIRSNQRRNSRSSRAARRAAALQRALRDSRSPSAPRARAARRCSNPSAARRGRSRSGPRSASWKSMTPGLRSPTHHQIARVIVAMHEHLRLRERFARSGTRSCLRRSPAPRAKASSSRCRAQNHSGISASSRSERLAVVWRELCGGIAARAPGSPRAPAAHRRTAAPDRRRRSGARDIAWSRGLRAAAGRAPSSVSCTCGTCTPMPSSSRETFR